MLKEKLLQEYASLQTQIQHVQNELKNLPTGKLIIAHDGKYQKWYVSDGHRKAYIPKKNQLLATHDIVIVALLHTLGVHKFVQDDWCGYVQGAFLAQDNQGNWQVYYAVPDKENRQKYTLFI